MLAKLIFNMAKLKKIECEICEEKDVNALHKHHIVERTELNTNNNPMNLAVICSNCHNKVHAGTIKIIGIYPSTKLPYGRILIYEINGKSNCPGITEPYFTYKPQKTKVHLNEK